MDLAFKVISIALLALALVLFFVSKKTFYKFCFIALLFFPKVDLIGVSGSSTGIRFDDLLILLFLILMLPKIISTLRKNRHLALLHGLIILWVICGLISTFVGMRHGLVNNPLLSVLTSIRKYEYFVAIFIGYFYFKKYPITSFMKMIKISSLFLLLIALLQYVHVIGGFVSGEYVSNLGAPIAVFNGPYEFACFMCIELIILFYDALKHGGSSYLFSLIALIEIFLTKSRTGLLLSIAIILVMSLVYSKKIFFTALFAGGLAFIILANTTSLIDRFASVNISQMMNIFSERIANGDYLAALERLPTEDLFPNITSDLSFYVRTTKWGAALNGFTMSPLFGYGPGQLAVLDGSYIKIISEGGIVSAIIFIVILGNVFKNYKLSKSKISVWILISIMCFALFIDIFDSSKIMEMFWMFTGSAFATKQIKVQIDEKVYTLKLQKSL